MFLSHLRFDHHRLYSQRQEWQIRCSLVLNSVSLVLWWPQHWRSQRPPPLLVWPTASLPKVNITEKSFYGLIDVPLKRSNVVRLVYAMICAFPAYVQRLLRHGAMPMRCALMWIARSAWMRVLMSLPISAGLGGLLPSGQPGKCHILWSNSSGVRQWFSAYSFIGRANLGLMSSGQ